MSDLPVSVPRPDRTHPDDDTRVQAVLYAAVHGDAAACDRFGVSARSLRGWRRKARDEGSDLARTFRLYALAVAPETRAESFGTWMRGQVEALSEVFLAKAAEVSATNPEALRALSEHMRTLLEHLVALEYLGALFADRTAAPSQDHIR